MTSITIELPDDLAEKAGQAGLLHAPVIEELIAAAIERATHDSDYFQQQIFDPVAQADAPDANWLTHTEVKAEWALERAALLSGKSLPTTSS